MKKMAVLFMVVCFGIVSCSKDNDNTMPADGQYIADALDLVVSMDLNNGKCTRFTVYICGEYFNQWFDVSTTGSYPKYIYRVDNMDIQTIFNSADNFNATLSGELTSADGNGFTAIDSDLSILFQIDNTVLDADGDGILDSMQ